MPQSSLLTQHSPGLIHPKPRLYWDTTVVTTINHLSLTRINYSVVFKLFLINAVNCHFSALKMQFYEFLKKPAGHAKLLHHPLPLLIKSKMSNWHYQPPGGIFSQSLQGQKSEFSSPVFSSVKKLFRVNYCPLQEHNCP